MTYVIRKVFIRTAAHSHNVCNVQIIVTPDLLHTRLSTGVNDFRLYSLMVNNNYSSRVPYTKNMRQMEEPRERGLANILPLLVLLVVIDLSADITREQLL